MAVTDWTSKGRIKVGSSDCFGRARFTVLIDEDFALSEKSGLPIQNAKRRIEQVTARIPNHTPLEVGAARADKSLPQLVKQAYDGGEYLHIYIKP
jgi:hypothetical protein